MTTLIAGQASAASTAATALPVAESLQRTHRFLVSFTYKAMIGGYVTMANNAKRTVVLVHLFEGDASIFAHGHKSI
ncbi:MAG: hypothetical protein ACK5P7_11095 [Bdellovibrio sp.]